MFSWPLRKALQRVAEEGSGIVVLLRKTASPRDVVKQLVSLSTPHASTPQPAGDEAQTLRTYGIGAQILTDLGVRKMRVLSGAPRKMQALSGFGLEVVEYVHTQ